MRYINRGARFAPRNAKRYAEQRGALLWTNGTTRNTAYRITENGPVLRRPLDYFAPPLTVVEIIRNSHRAEYCWKRGAFKDPFGLLVLNGVNLLE